jgi:hypothetical protein
MYVILFSVFALLQSLGLQPLLLANDSPFMDILIDSGVVLTLSPPSLSTSHSLLRNAQVGDELVLVSDARNLDSTYDWDAVVIFEVRDSRGVTIFLSSHQGTVKAESTSQFGVLWIPDNAGEYELRTYAITSLNNPRILSPIASTAEVPIEDNEVKIDYSILPEMMMYVYSNGDNNPDRVTEVIGSRGSYCWDICADYMFIVPEIALDVRQGATVEFQITNNRNPDEIHITVLSDANEPTDMELTAVSFGQFRVDLPMDREYILLANANWFNGEFSAGDALFYYKIHVI